MLEENLETELQISDMVTEGFIKLKFMEKPTESIR